MRKIEKSLTLICHIILVCLSDLNNKRIGAGPLINSLYPKLFKKNTKNFYHINFLHTKNDIDQ